jgi:outer membrane assembly lipoprotein YfiO
MYFGCAQKSAQLQKGIAPPDRTLFERGQYYLEKGQYTPARIALQTLLNTYPDSDVAADAYFAMGDTFYEEGGTENLLQAENQYKDFIIFYAGDIREADAQMKIISLNKQMMRSPDRDPQYARRTLEEIERFERRYPSHDYLPLVRQMKVEVEDNLARGDLGVGEYYLRRGNLLGAIGRLQYVTENYKNFEDMDRVMFRIGELLDRVQSPDAADWYAKIAEGYPLSRYFEDAKKRLAEMGLEIPEVNEALAAANQANIRPSAGFSPFRPLIDFGKALGFIAPPDPYDVVRKAVEEEKAQAAKAAAGAGTGTGDDIQIDIEIRRNPSGAPVDGETSAPSTGSDNSGVSPDISSDSTPASDAGVNQPGGAGQQSKPKPRYAKP